MSAPQQYGAKMSAECSLSASALMQPGQDYPLSKQEQQEI